MTSRNILTSANEIARAVRSADGILLGLDFDGTLAAIRSRPEEARLPDEVREHLRLLGRHPAITLMIVSGREIQDLAKHVGLSEPIYAGNHGLEIRGPGFAFEHPEAARFAPSLQALVSRAVDRVAGFTGALVEPKKLTASVHYRNVSPKSWRNLELAVREVVAGDPDRFVITAGHCVWEIRPRVDWHKGRALRWILDRRDFGLVFYFGDDLTDEDAFREIPDGVTIKVGKDSSPTLARYRLDGPADVECILRRVVDAATNLA